MSLDPTQIIKKPMVTEKTTWESGARNHYAFEVLKEASKPQIKKAVELLYGVRVERVSTQIRKGSFFRTRFGAAKRSDWKKATVHLHEDDRIEIF